jgi:predicted DNA-binding ribbon-helix-helix protein
MVKLKPATHAQLQEIAREDDTTMGEVVAYLVDRYQG